MTTLLARGQITIAAIKDGTDGKPGKDGVSVSVVSTTVEYQISSSATSAPTSGWSTTVKQATDAQPYLWSRTVVKYSDGKSTTTYGVAYKGKNGAQGEQGYGIVAAIQREKMYKEETWAVWAKIGHTESWGVSVEDRNGCRIGDIFTVSGTATDTGNYHIAYYRSTTDSGELVGVCIAHSISPKGDKGNTGNAGLTFANGKSMFKDLLFDEGYNGCQVYNNMSNSNVKLTIVPKSSDNPYAIAKKELKIETTGAATPGHGGVMQIINARANAVFVRRVIAKIPQGCSLETAENAMGTGMVKKWLTPSGGTGTFTEYIYMYQCGASGNFVNGGHMYLWSSTTATADKPVVWYIASCETYDMTAGSSAQIKSTEVMYATSTSGTSAPTSGWQKNIPTVASGSFLWSRFTVTYMDGSNAVSYNVSKMGDRGPQGPTGAAGKDAVSASFSPAALTFSAKTEGNGNCLADVSSGNTATITMLEGSSVVTGTYSITTKVGCDADISGNTVKVKSVAYDTIDGRAISRTSASVTVKCEYNGKTCYVSLPISVSVSAVWGGLVTSQKGLESKYTEVSNKYNALPLKTNNELTQYTSTIKQSAKEISLKVSQTAVGRKNLLPGSALRRQGEGTDSTLGGNWPVYGNSGIQTIENVDGVNSYSLIFEKYGQYGCIGWHGGSSGNIKVEKGKTYTLSFWAKRNMTDVWCYYEIWYMPSKTAPHGDSNRIKLTSSYLSFSGLNTWELKTVTFSIPQDATMEYIEILLLCTPNSDKTYTNKIQCWYCQPMLVEGDEYVGWSLSEEDAEYIGGNLLDNTDTLVQGGNLTVRDGSYSALHPRDNSDDEINRQSYKGFPTLNTDIRYATDVNSIDMLEWGLSSDVIKQGQDYMFSFMAKGNKGGQFTAYFFKNGNQVVFTEVLDRVVGPNQHAAADGNAQVEFKEDYVWKKYWVHWRVVGGDVPSRVLIRCTKGTDMYVSQPKLEYGTTVTEYRATKTDFVEDKSVAGKLLDAGIDITAKRITLTADNTVFRTRSGKETAVVDEDGLKAASISTVTNGTKAGVEISGGLARFFGDKGVCNIRIGVDASGMAVLSYYDDDGNLLYDLGPSGLDTKGMTAAKLEEVKLCRVSDVLGSAYKADWTILYDLSDGETYPVAGSKEIQKKLFNTEYMGVWKENNTETLAVINHRPTSGVAKTTLYRYTAARVQNAYVADSNRGLTAAMAAKANGKYFTSQTIASGGALVNLANDEYLKPDTQPRSYAMGYEPGFPRFALEPFFAINDGVSKRFVVYSMTSRGNNS